MKPNQINDLSHTVEKNRAEAEGPASAGAEEKLPVPRTKIEPTAEPTDAQYFWTLVWDSECVADHTALRLLNAKSAEEAARIAMKNFKASHSAELISDVEWEVTVAEVDQCTAAELRASCAGNDDSLGSENTYLVRAVTVVADYSEWKRRETDKFVVLAGSARQAYWLAMNHHIAEFFSGWQQGGSWETGRNFNNEECLEFCPGYAERDSGVGISIFIEEMRKLPPEDALTLKKYLVVVDDSPAPVHG